MEGVQLLSHWNERWNVHDSLLCEGDCDCRIPSSPSLEGKYSEHGCPCEVQVCLSVAMSGGTGAEQRGGQGRAFVSRYKFVCRWHKGWSNQNWRAEGRAPRSWTQLGSCQTVQRNQRAEGRAPRPQLQVTGCQSPTKVPSKEKSAWEPSENRQLSKN